MLANTQDWVYITILINDAREDMIFANPYLLHPFDDTIFNSFVCRVDCVYNFKRSAYHARYVIVPQDNPWRWRDEEG